MGLLDQLAVSVKIANRGIDLANCKSHESACTAGMIVKSCETGHWVEIVAGCRKIKISENLDRLPVVDTLRTHWPHRLVA